MYAFQRAFHSIISVLHRLTHTRTTRTLAFSRNPVLNTSIVSLTYVPNMAYIQFWTCIVRVYCSSILCRLATLVSGLHSRAWRTKPWLALRSRHSPPLILDTSGFPNPVSLVVGCPLEALCFKSMGSGVQSTQRTCRPISYSSRQMVRRSLCCH